MAHTRCHSAQCAQGRVESKVLKMLENGNYLDKAAGVAMQIDNLDQALIGLLRQNARTSLATLASKLGVSRGTVTNRMERLERDGVVVGYTARLRPAAEPNVLRACMSIAIEGNDTRRVMASLLGEPGVAALHSTNGRWDLLAELQVTSLEDLSRVLERIRLIKGISNTETSIHLESFRISS